MPLMLKCRTEMSIGNYVRADAEAGKPIAGIPLRPVYIPMSATVYTRMMASNSLCRGEFSRMARDKIACCYAENKKDGQDLVSRSSGHRVIVSRLSFL